MKKNIISIKNADILIAIVVIVLLFCKNLLFHWSCFGYLAFSSLWREPVDFFAFYFAKLLPGIFIASFVFLTRRRWWIVLIFILLDLWLISNMIYYRVNDFFLDVDIIMLVGNMNGFWFSVISYINWEMFAIVGVTVIMYLFLLFIKRISIEGVEKKYRAFLLTMSIVCLLGVYDWTLGYKNTKETDVGANDGWKYNFITASRQGIMGVNILNIVYKQWMEAQGPMYFFPAITWAYVHYIFYHSYNDVSLTEFDKTKISSYCKNRTFLSPDENLIIILGESFESWVIDVFDEDSVGVMPNFSKYINMNNIFYSSKIKSQVKAGTSGDGQMIINTGLLPISSGVACMAYGDNVWPNIASTYKNSYLINPTTNVWNQRKMTENYGYGQLIQKSVPNPIGDSVAFSMAGNVIDSCKQPFCIQVITISTHVPFDCGGRKSMNFPKEMPDNLRNYLNCMHYADSCIGTFLAKLEKDSLMDNTTIVITGDHTINKRALLEEYQPFCEKYYNYKVPIKETYCPLLIISSKIKERQKIEELCYQMDIYPTIIKIIGEKGYYWNGVGVDLMDSAARKNRKIQEKEAYNLSEKIIRSDFFAEIVK